MNRSMEFSEALRLAGGDRKLLSMLAVIFCEQTTLLREQIEEAIANHDCALLERAAHTLKGSASVFAAHPLVRVASEMERAGREHDLAGAFALYDRLDCELRALTPILEQVKQGIDPGFCCSSESASDVTEGTVTEAAGCSIGLNRGLRAMEVVDDNSHRR